MAGEREAVLSDTGEKKTACWIENNSLDWVRLFAALQIAVTHFLGLMLISYREPGAADTVLLYGRRALAFFPGLILLFAISGFLMANAMERTEKKNRFLKRRFLRIYPALWVNIVLTAALVAAVLRPAGAERGELVRWICVQALGAAYTPDFLKGFGTGSLNGTLWAVMVEVQIYLLLYLFWGFLKKRKAAFWGVCFFFSVFLNLSAGFLEGRGILPPTAAALLSRTCLPYLVWFLAGFCLYRFRDRVMEPLIRWLPALWIFYAVYRGLWQICGWPTWGYYEDIAASLLLPCLAIGTGCALGRHRRKNDISYGIFLYHWLLINLIFYYDLPAGTDHVLLLIGYCLAFWLLGSASWFLLERRVLRK